MSRADPRQRATWRWGGAIASLLVIQSLALAGIFWVLANGSHRRATESALAEDCGFVALAPPGERVKEMRELLVRDVHRNRFLALFDGTGRLIDGNVARLPARPPGTRGSFVARVQPTELPGRTSDVARLTICPLSGGTRLLAGVDLDGAEEAVRLVGRSLMLGLLPGILIAVAFGLAGGRRAARQVDAVGRLTARIVAGALDERLPVPTHPDSFGLLCAHVNTMLDRLQRLIGEVRGVGDDIAHQLRTPLTRLRAGIERAMGDARDPAAFRAAATRALDEIDKLLGIVAALLRIRELEDAARRSRFAPVDLARLVDDACDLHRPGAEDEGVALDCATMPAPPVEGDASLLIEAVSNLVDNAIKFGPPGGRVLLRLAREEGVAVISVRDEGAGVPPAERRLVTQRFYRGRHDREGVGLGLSLVQAIADLHGFELRFGEEGSVVALVCRASPRETSRLAGPARGHDPARPGAGHRPATR